MLFFSLFLAVLITGILQAKNLWVGWYGLLKFLEFIFLGFYVSFAKIRFEKIALIFSFGVIFESVLAISQYLHQGSMGGLFYFFGERAFNSQTPGIANASLNGELILRPYGTLPHPNVLGGYLTIALAMLISNFQFPISNFRKTFLFLTIIVGTVVLVLTMSRIAILLWLAVLGLISIKKLKENFKKRKASAFLFLLSVLIILAVPFSFPLKARLLDINIRNESIVERIVLMKSSVMMVKEHPIFGVGLNNFLVNLPAFQTQSSDIFNLQPVHNIYALVGAETGLVGLLFFLWFIITTFKHFVRKNQFHPFGKSSTPRSLRLEELRTNFKFQILFIVLVLGFFDHYFLTLQQGRMLFAFVLGLCWSKKLKF